MDLTWLLESKLITMARNTFAELRQGHQLCTLLEKVNFAIVMHALVTSKSNLSYVASFPKMLT